MTAPSASSLASVSESRGQRCAGVRAARLRKGAASALVLAACAASTVASAQQWRFIPSFGAEETFTNNVDLTPPDTRQSDFVTQITPSLAFTERGQRTRLDGFISLPVLLYARTGSENNNIYPSASVIGDLEVVERFFHVEASANVSQQLFSPFGAQPNDLSNASANRYRAQTFSVSPYIVGTTSGGTSYELRNNNVWTILSGAPIQTNNSNYTEFLAKAENTQQQLGFRANYDFNEVRFTDDTSIRTQIGRVVPVYTVDPQLRLLASVGYEDNQYTFTHSRDTIYGGGFEWSPTERTMVVGNYEHRFFGASYLILLKHRTPLSEWSIQASRNITTYPQQIATVPVGLDVAGFLDSLFLSSIPDAASRQSAVNELIRTRGLPSTLVTPISVYSQQILLQESQTATFALIGARNTILFTIYNVKSQPITAAGSLLPTVPGINNDNTQTGGSVVWTNRLSSMLVLTASVNAYRTVSNDEQFPGETKQGIAQVVLSSPVGAHTTAFVGGRFQRLISDVVTNYNEAAAFIGVAYTFK
jgi:uncharacterized protein (PEP-CTERM system associated)